MIPKRLRRIPLILVWHLCNVQASRFINSGLGKKTRNEDDEGEDEDEDEVEESGKKKEGKQNSKKKARKQQK